MKFLNSYIKMLLVILSALLLTGCVHDDKYDTPDLSTYQCGDLKATKTLAELKAMPQEQTFTTDDVVEGYVSSSDETGNIYKYLYIQDKPENPTQGLVISVDAVSTYANFPQGSKVYIKLKGLAMGKYGDFIQLGAMDAANVFGRIPEKMVPTNIVKSCTEKATIIPKVMTLADLKPANDALVGALIQINNAEFHANTLCLQYAPDGTSADRGLTDPTHTAATTKVARNSGYATFATKTLPSGNGKFVGILSKFRTTYQFYIVRDTDLEMNGPRLDKKVAPCAADPNASKFTVAQAKALYKSASNPTLIKENATLTAKVTANDQTGNLFKYLYVEDATGGIRININMTDLYLDKRFQVGRMLTVNLKDLYIGDKDGELQLGGLFNGNVGQVELADTYKHFFANDTPVSAVTATERTISTLTTADVGKWIKIKDLQVTNADLWKNFADGTSDTNRTLEDCNGNKIILRTNGRADFGKRDEPLLANNVQMDTGKGDVYAVLQIFRGTYQLRITKLRDIDLDNPRCDGTLPPKMKFTAIFEDPFADLTKWNAVSITGTQGWRTQTVSGNTFAVMSGFQGGNFANEDWLISKNAVELTGYDKYFLSFDNDKRFAGNDIETYITENYTGNPATTNWVKLNPTLDTDEGAYGWANSGNIDLAAYAGKKIFVAFKYTSTTSAAATWEIDNVKISGAK